MSPEELAEDDQIRAIVERTCRKQGIPLAVPPEVCADVARLITRAEPIVAHIASAQEGDRVAS
jgi:hypothetical protein